MTSELPCIDCKKPTRRRIGPGKPDAGKPLCEQCSYTAKRSAPHPSPLPATSEPQRYSGKTATRRREPRGGSPIEPKVIAPHERPIEPEVIERHERPMGSPHAPPPDTKPTQRASQRRRGREDGQPPPGIASDTKLTHCARFVAWVLAFFSTPAIAPPNLRVCHLDAGIIAMLTGLHPRGVHEQIKALIKAGWVGRGRLAEHPKGEAVFVFILHPSPLSGMEVARRGRKRQPVHAPPPPKMRRDLTPWFDDLTFARARGKRREREQARDALPRPSRGGRRVHEARDPAQPSTRHRPS